MPEEIAATNGVVAEPESQQEKFEFILTDPVREQTFKCVFALPSAKKRKALKAIDEERMAKYAELGALFPDIATVAKLDETERKKRYNTDPALLLRNRQLLIAQQDAEDRAVLQVVQLAINTKVLAEGLRELVAQDVDNDFWQEQDWWIMREASRRFHLACSDGRRSHFTSPIIPDLEGGNAVETGRRTSGTTGEKNAGVDE